MLNDLDRNTLPNSKAVVLLKDGKEVRRWQIRPPRAPVVPEPQPEPVAPLRAALVSGNSLGDLLLAPEVRGSRDMAFQIAIEMGHTPEEAEMVGSNGKEIRKRF